MSNAKIRAWVYRAIGFLILCGIAWFFLLRSSEYDADAAKKIFSDHKANFQTVAEYMIDKKIETDILGFRTIDNSYGIRGEDTPEFKKFSAALSSLQQSQAIDSVHSHSGIVTFNTYSSGGMLVENHVELSYADDTETKASLGSRLPEAHWFYSIEETKKKD